MRFLDWCVWRIQALSAEVAADREAEYWERGIVECQKRAQEFRDKAAAIREAKIRARFKHPRGIA